MSGISGIGGGNSFQQVNFMGENDTIFEESAPDSTPVTIHEDGQAQQVSDDIPLQNVTSPRSLFGGQDFSGVGDTTPQYTGPILSTGRQIPSYEEFSKMSDRERKEFMETLTYEEKQELPHKLEESMNPGGLPQSKRAEAITLSTGKSAPSFDEFSKMTVAQKQEFLTTLTSEERVEYVQKLEVNSQPSEV